MLQKFKSLRASGASRMTARGALFGRFAKNGDGVAAVEFALLAPLMLTLMLGALEITQSIWADGKVEQATSTIGDLVSRTQLMDDTQFADLGEAGPLILRPNPQNDLNFVVTSVMACRSDPNDNTSALKYFTLWSRKWEAGQAQASPHQRDLEFSRQPSELDIVEGDTLIVTEGLYNYSPTISRKVGTTWEMGGYSFHQPRAKNKRISYVGQENPNPVTCNCLRANSC